jgi:2,4-dienoyl-CoA reductase-like NADH-dependent reductase (Old Yellow Enzyme family)
MPAPDPATSPVTAPLFTPWTVGPCALSHRVVMAPLTRMRASDGQRAHG